MARTFAWDVRNAAAPQPANDPVVRTTFGMTETKADASTVDVGPFEVPANAELIVDDRIRAELGSSVVMTVTDYDAAGNPTANVSDSFVISDTVPPIQRGKPNVENLREIDAT